jgi:hypothetical protein
MYYRGDGDTVNKNGSFIDTGNMCEHVVANLIQNPHLYSGKKGSKVM